MAQGESSRKAARKRDVAQATTAQPLAASAATVVEPSPEPLPAKAAKPVPVKIARPTVAPRPVAKDVPAPTTAPIAATAPTIDTANAAIPPAAVSAATNVQKEMMMATNFETPKMFTDMNDRAKAAMDKSGKFVAEMGEFGKGNVEAMVESSRIAAKGVEALGQDVAEYGRKSFEGMTATLKSLASVKSPVDFFKLQGDYMRSSFDAAVAQSSKNTEAMMKLAGETAQPISSRFAVAVDKVKAAA